MPAQRQNPVQDLGHQNSEAAMCSPRLSASVQLSPLPPLCQNARVLAARAHNCLYICVYSALNCVQCQARHVHQVYTHPNKGQP